MSENNHAGLASSIVDSCSLEELRQHLHSALINGSAIMLSSNSAGVLYCAMSDTTGSTARDSIPHKWDADGDHCEICGASDWMIGGCILPDQAQRAIFAFEEKYKRDARDPMSADKLQVWFDAWNASTNANDNQDTARLNFIENQNLSLKCESGPTGGDDFVVWFEVIEYYQAEPTERMIGRAETARAAIDVAIRELAK